jgi:organic hydroperoxide reductase OsmC/OhrA
MSEHSAEVSWRRGEAAFLDNRYSRVHSWQFDGGAEITASSSPAVVPLPMSSTEAVDPEEAFVASLSSCHMLWFLAMAAQRNHVVNSYHDNAVGVLASVNGKKRFVEVVLKPLVLFSGETPPSESEVTLLHERAHEHCYLANSVSFAVRCEPRVA